MASRKQYIKQKEGFIVHPNWTNDNKYHASYGNHNKTIKSFKSLNAAKAYLKKKGYNQALYDNSSGNPQTLKIAAATRSKPKSKSSPKKRRSSNMDFGIGSSNLFDF